MNKAIIAILIFLSFQFETFSKSNLNNITFSYKNDYSIINFWANSKDLTIDKYNYQKNKQIILEISPIISKKEVLRGFDTSEFKGAVVYVNIKKLNNKIRAVIQLRENVQSKIEKYSNRIVLKVENFYGAFAKSNINVIKNDNVNIENTEIHVPKSNSIVDILENLTMSGPKKYIGKKITLNVKDIKVTDLLRVISEASGFNIIQSNGIGSMPPMANLSLIDIPWDQALDTIMSLNKLVAKKNGIILLVKTESEETKDKEEKEKLKKLSEKEEPLVTKLFPISFSELKELESIVKDYLTQNRGTIKMDKRTSTIIVTDTATVIEKIKKIVKLLDTQTPQVLINSRIVEVSDKYTKEIGLKSGFTASYDPVGAPVGDSATPGFSLSTASFGDNGFLGIGLAAVGRLTNLDFKLQMLETESKAKIISSPRVITKNNVKAEINSSETSNYAETTSEGGVTSSSFKEKTAKTSLSVTPHITNEGSIVLDISLSKEDFGAADIQGGPPTVSTNSVKTNVLVDNGSTVALGGIYKYSSLKTTAGVPYLRNLPLFGWLFRTPNLDKIDKKELIIFLTPRILNQEEAGIADNV